MDIGDDENNCGHEGRTKREIAPKTEPSRVNCFSLGVRTFVAKVLLIIQAVLLYLLKCGGSGHLAATAA